MISLRRLESFYIEKVDWSRFAKVISDEHAGNSESYNPDFDDISTKEVLSDDEEMVSALVEIREKGSE